MRKLLFVWSSAAFATFDVARGYRNALQRQNCFDIKDYKLYSRMQFFADALGPKGENINLLSRVASENIVVEAMKHRADVVFIVSGMALHPDAIWLLRRASIPTVCLFTESPYNDAEQRAFHAVYPEMVCLTTERTSARDGWHYLPHAYDPEIHHPVAAEATYDVLMIGTLWRERIALLERVDWTGIRLKLFGTWVAPPLPGDSPLAPFYEDVCVHNYQTPPYYAAALINLNMFRAHPAAESLNPRNYELAACGAFQLSDYRSEIADVFGDYAVGTFTADDLEGHVRFWLARPAERREYADRARTAVATHTFDARVATLMQALDMAANEQEIIAS